MLTEEHFFNCPYCGAEISMVLDISVPHQEYIEDCEVCCNPINISYEFNGEVLSSFSATAME